MTAIPDHAISRARYLRCLICRLEDQLMPADVHSGSVGYEWGDDWLDNDELTFRMEELFGLYELYPGLHEMTGDTPQLELFSGGDGQDDE